MKGKSLSDQFQPNQNYSLKTGNVKIYLSLVSNVFNTYVTEHKKNTLLNNVFFTILQLCSNCLSVLPSFWLLHRNEVVILRFACLGSLAICLTYCLISLAYVRIAEILVHIRHTMPEKHLSLSTLFSKWGRATFDFQ